MSSIFSSCCISTIEWILEAYLLLIVLKEQFPHISVWLSKLIIFCCYYCLHLDSNIFRNILYFLFYIRCFCFLYWYSFLICENNNFVSFFGKLSQFFWDRLVPIYPVLGIFSKFSPTFCVNQCRVHIESCNLGATMRGGLSDNTAFNIFPYPAW